MKYKDELLQNMNKKDPIGHDKNGKPYRLLASTQSESLRKGKCEISVNMVPLVPGKYWLLGNFQRDVSIGKDTADNNVNIYYCTLKFSGSLPEIFPEDGLKYTGSKFNYYIIVSP